MHAVLCGLTPGFQHIRNSYTSAGNQNAATLEWLLGFNDAMDSATPPQAAFVTQVAPSNILNTAGCLHCQCPASLFDLWCETNGNHFTEECCNLQCSKEQGKANCTQSKARTSKGKPQWAKPTDTTGAKFAGESSCILSFSDLVTNQYWNPDTGATCQIHSPYLPYCLHFHWYWSDGQVLFQASVTGHSICQLLGSYLHYMHPILPVLVLLHFLTLA